MAYKKLFARLLIAAALLAPLTVAARAQPQKTEVPDPIAGQLLVATPQNGDPRFAHTVILVIAHDGDGAFGLTINRPVGKHPMGELLDAVGQKHGHVNGDISIFAGGPIQERIGFILHSSDYHDPTSTAVGKGVAVTSSAAILRDMARGKGPRKTLVAFGYAGWMPGQLEAEIDKHAWAIAPLDPKLIFDTDPDKLWDLAWARRTISL